VPQSNIQIKENSFKARLAARMMKASNMAIVFGNTIHIWGVTKQEFLQNKRWVKHELKHIEQYRQHGYFGFLAKYVWESIRHGYYNNKFEIEAREAEEA
jgi:Domain of unknown function (DUF4157)